MVNTSIHLHRLFIKYKKDPFSLPRDQEYITQCLCHLLSTWPQKTPNCCWLLESTWVLRTSKYVNWWNHRKTFHMQHCWLDMIRIDTRRFNLGNCKEMKWNQMAGHVNNSGSTKAMRLIGVLINRGCWMDTGPRVVLLLTPLPEKCWKLGDSLNLTIFPVTLYLTA